MTIWERGKRAGEICVAWRETAAAASDHQPRLWQSARTWARHHLPGSRIISANQATDRRNTLSGNCLRLWLREHDREHIVVACSGNAEEAHTLLTQALLWLTCLRAEGRLRGAVTAHLLVPAGRSAVLCHRSNLVNPDRAKIEIWEYHEDEEQLWQTRKPQPPPAPLEERDFRWPVLGPFRWSPLLARVMDLAPEAIQRYPRFLEYDSLRLLGLEFARVLGPDRDHVHFGVGAQKELLTDEDFAALRDLVQEILYYRRPDTPSTDHSFYRMQAERWLESLLLDNVANLFPELEPGSVYPQIPVYLGEMRGRVDILGADRSGNLVVMELKVEEDPELPLQSLDYWGRVNMHNLDGDFEKRGYFPGVRLSRARPEVYLVSPIFSFHDSLERLLRCLDPRLLVTKIAINEDWRGGVRILRRSRYRCGDL